MQNVKRLEIITNTLEMREVRATLEAEGVRGYTVIPRALGSGERGQQSGDDLSDAFSNALLLTACLPEDAPRLIEAVRPILKKSGGVCLVSDAQWVIH